MVWKLLRTHRWSISNEYQKCYSKNTLFNRCWTVSCNQICSNIIVICWANIGTCILLIIVWRRIIFEQLRRLIDGSSSDELWAIQKFSRKTCGFMNIINPLSANPTKRSGTLKQSVGNIWVQIFWEELLVIAHYFLSENLKIPIFFGLSLLCFILVEWMKLNIWFI